MSPIKTITHGFSIRVHSDGLNPLKLATECNVLQKYPGGIEHIQTHHPISLYKMLCTRVHKSVSKVSITLLCAKYRRAPPLGSGSLEHPTPVGWPAMSQANVLKLIWYDVNVCQGDVPVAETNGKGCST